MALAAQPDDVAAARSEADTVVAAIARLSGVVAGATRWPVAERRVVLARLDRAVDALVAVRAAVLVAERDAGAWRGGGDRSFEAWRGRTSNAGDRAAVAQVRQAEHLAAVPGVTAAVADGRIGVEQAAVIGRVAVTGTPAQRAAVTDPAGQAHLVALAGEVDAGVFATTVARWAATVDPDALERDHQAQHRARFVHLTHTPRGTLIKGRLDTIAGHRLRLALEALTTRPGAEDDRDPGQRRADALDTMAGHVLTDPRTRPGAHVPPHVSLILTEQTWTAARTHRDHQRATLRKRAAGDLGADAARRGSLPAQRTATNPTVQLTDEPARAESATDDPATGDQALTEPSTHQPVGYEPATLEDGTPVPPSVVAAIMCDCDVTRIVIDAEGAPLDLGRTRRLFSGPQRRAVIARDRHCTWPGCHTPARWCQIHHTQWWDRDHGHTRVDLGVLLCTYHHHETHRRDLTITRHPRPPITGTAGPPTATLTRVRYEFRDPTGRLVAEPFGRAPKGEGAAPTAAASTSVVSESGVLLNDSGGTTAYSRVTEPDSARRALPTTGDPPAADDLAAITGDGGQSDRLDLERVTDPMTGMAVPAFFLAR